MVSQSYIVAPDAGFITCLRCGKTSYNPNDVQQRYCGHCHVFHEESELDQPGQMGQGRVHIVQCLCPQRHCILAVAYEEGASNSQTAMALLRETMGRLRVNPWCGICGLSGFTYEDRRTPFATLGDAAAFLTLCQFANLNAMELYARMPKAN